MKKQLPQPKRSQFDHTELLQRISDLEARVAQLETHQLFRSGNLIGGFGGPAKVGGSGLQVG